MAKFYLVTAFLVPKRWKYMYKCVWVDVTAVLHLFREYFCKSFSKPIYKKWTTDEEKRWRLLRHICTYTFTFSVLGRLLQGKNWLKWPNLHEIQLQAPQKSRVWSTNMCKYDLVTLKMTLKQSKCLTNTTHVFYKWQKSNFEKFEKSTILLIFVHFWTIKKNPFLHFLRKIQKVWLTFRDNFFKMC